MILYAWVMEKESAPGLVVRQVVAVYGTLWIDLRRMGVDNAAANSGRHDDAEGALEWARDFTNAREKEGFILMSPMVAHVPTEALHAELTTAPNTTGTWLEDILRPHRYPR